MHTQEEEVCNTRICNITHQGAARGGPVVLHPVRVTPSYFGVTHISMTVSCCSCLLKCFVVVVIIIVIYFMLSGV